MRKTVLLTYRKLRRILPDSIQEHLFMFGAAIDRLKKQKEKERLLKTVMPESEEAGKIIEYLRHYPYSMIPYSWFNEYLIRPVYVEYDSACELYYVLWNDLKIYFYDTRKSAVACYFNTISGEMDIRSPHRYITEQNDMIGTIDTGVGEYEASKHNENTSAFCVADGDVVADIGCAEGNFSLGIINRAAHVYLFEPDTNWLPALQQTFKAFKDKVTIVNKMVSDYDSECTVTLDTFFKDKPVHFIKADIEGAEGKMLAGARGLFSNHKNIKAAVCTYHKKEDADDFKNYFNELGYKTSFTDGYMAVDASLRKGVIRAEAAI